MDELGEALNGTTHISPDQLETAIKNNGGWGAKSYNVLNHNRHDFVKFCLDRIGCPESMIQKVGPCYKKQKWLAILNFDLEKKFNLKINLK